MLAASGNNRVLPTIFANGFAVLRHFDSFIFAQFCMAVDVLDFIFLEKEMHAFIDLISNAAAAFDNFAPFKTNLLGAQAEILSAMEQMINFRRTQ